MQSMVFARLQNINPPWWDMYHLMDGWRTRVLVSVFLRIILQGGELSETNLWHSSVATLLKHNVPLRHKLCDLRVLTTDFVKGSSSEDSLDDG